MSTDPMPQFTRTLADGPVVIQIVALNSGNHLQMRLTGDEPRTYRVSPPPTLGTPRPPSPPTTLKEG